MRRPPKDTILVPAALIREECAAMLVRQARRAEREYRGTRKVGHMLGATWLRSAAQHLRSIAHLDTRHILPFPRQDATTQPVRKRGGQRP